MAQLERAAMVQDVDQTKYEKGKDDGENKEDWSEISADGVVLLLRINRLR